MSATFTHISVYAASWGFITAGVWKFFDWTNDVASPELKTKTSLWIKSLNLKTVMESSGGIILDTFNTFFGPKHFSGKCFLRSTLITLFCLTIVYSLFLMRQKTNIFQNHSNYIVFPVFIVSSVLQNYIALLKTRKLLNLNKHSKYNGIAIIIADIALTFIIGAASYFIFILILELIFAKGGYVYYTYLSVRDVVLFNAPGPANSGDLVSLTFYSIFTASVWIWTYLFAALLLKIAIKVNPYFDRFKNQLDIENKPIKSLAYISLAFITITYIFILPFYLYFFF